MTAKILYGIIKYVLSNPEYSNKRAGLYQRGEFTLMVISNGYRINVRGKTYKIIIM